LDESNLCEELDEQILEILGDIRVGEILEALDLDTADSEIGSRKLAGSPVLPLDEIDVATVELHHTIDGSHPVLKGCGLFCDRKSLGHQSLVAPIFLVGQEFIIHIGFAVIMFSKDAPGGCDFGIHFHLEYVILSHTGTLTFNYPRRGGTII
jgi:hypothetical protein